MKPNPVAMFVDNQDSFDMVKPMLERMLGQPQLIHCKNRKEAIDFIDSDQYADIIFADWELSGYPFMHSVREDLENHNTPVIITSDDTTVHKIVEENICRGSTFFLAKPFLERGLVSKYHEVLDTLEWRRKNRIHPPCPVNVEVKFNDSLEYSLPLADISLDGCLLRVPLEISDQIRIYQDARIWFAIDEFNVDIHGQVYRIGQDRLYPGNNDTVLVMVKFSQTHQEKRDFLELIDELEQRWIDSCDGLS